MSTIVRPAGRLTGGQLALRVARWLVLALVAASILAVLASLAMAPAYVASQRDALMTPEGWKAEQVQAALAGLGWHPDAAAWFFFMRPFIFFLATLLPGLLILRRKSHDWFGLYVAFAFIVAPALVAIEPVLGLLQISDRIIFWLSGLPWQLYFILFYVFPDGHFVPRWTRWLVPVWMGFNFLTVGFADPEASGRPSGTVVTFLYISLISLVLIAIGSQIYRYFLRSNPVQRQQTKWVVLALAVTFLIGLPLGPASQRPSIGQPLETTLQLEIGRLGLLDLSGFVVPMVLAIAILRYRLWDIDLIIRRTLVYSILTGLLATTYFGSILVFESVVRAITGQGQNSLVIVLSTLAIAALSVPLRRRVQSVIDRRFFRSKYDAARILAGFSVAARDEVDLDRLSAQLVEVVDETMQPASVGLWLRKAKRL